MGALKILSEAKKAVPVISVVGLKKSGKTTVVEHIVKRLVTMNYRVGTIKSMVHSNFTIDVEGKDTFRHRQAGASFVISLSRNETAFIRTNPRRQDLDEISKLIPEDTDVVVSEGLNDTGPDIYQLVACKDINAMEETLRVRNIGENVVALTGLMSNKISEHSQYPIFNVTKDDELTTLIELLFERIGL